MDLISAIKSGKRFRRNLEGSGWWQLSPMFKTELSFSVDDILSDWIVAEEKIEITRSQLEKAWDKADRARFPSDSPYSEKFKFFLKELGFGADDFDPTKKGAGE